MNWTKSIFISFSIRKSFGKYIYINTVITLRRKRITGVGRFHPTCVSHSKRTPRARYSGTANFHDPEIFFFITTFALFVTINFITRATTFPKEIGIMSTSRTLFIAFVCNTTIWNRPLRDIMILFTVRRAAITVESYFQTLYLSKNQQRIMFYDRRCVSSLRRNTNLIVCIRSFRLTERITTALKRGSGQFLRWH